MREASLRCVEEMALSDERIVFIGSDVGPGVLASLERTFPDRHFIEGICEQFVVGMAAGLALEGYIPFVNTIASFLVRRCLEQIEIDLCLHDLPVRLLGYGGGVVYAPLGPTHLATDDFALLRPLPNMAIIAPCDANEAVSVLRMTADWAHPLYLRLARGDDEQVTDPTYQFQLGAPVTLRAPQRIVLASTGTMTQRALHACDALTATGIPTGVIHCPTIKPFGSTAFCRLVEDRTDLIVTVEEHLRTGGLGSAVLEAVSDLPRPPRVLRLGLPDGFISAYGSQEEVLAALELDDHAIFNQVQAEAQRLWL